MFGLPILIAPWLYRQLDFIPFACFFGYLSVALDGTASKLLAGLAVFHTLHSIVTDYEGNGKSLVQRLFGSNVFSLPLSVMYYFDAMVAIAFIFLPMYMDGFNDPTATLLVQKVTPLLLLLLPFTDNGT